MNIKIVFFDFDGTIYSHFSHSIPNSTIKAFKKLKEKGILIFLCTGRALSELNNFNLDALYFDGYIMNNGLAIYNNQKELLFFESIKGELKKEIIKVYQDKKIPLFLSTRNGMIINYLNDHVIRIQNDISATLPNIKEYKDEEFCMATAFFNNDNEQELNNIKKLGDVSYWHIGAIDILEKGCNKKTGISKILKEYQIDKKEAMAFGDGDNDIDMLKYCGLGIALGNAIEEAKEIADDITDNIDDDGIYNALIKYQIIS